MDRPSLVAWHRFLTLRSGDSELPRPNLIGVGAARAGTTTLFHILRDTPGVFMSEVKELRYFADRYDKWTEREYLLFFHGTEEVRWRGEFSPHYLHHPEAAHRIRLCNPDAHIVIQLRDPVQRALSQFRKHRTHHGMDDADEYFALALDAHRSGTSPGRWWHPVHNLRQSFVRVGIDRFEAAFPEQQIHAVFLDDLEHDAQAALSPLSGTLGLDLAPHASRHENRSTSTAAERPLTATRREELASLFAPDWDHTCRRFGREPSEFRL